MKKLLLIACILPLFAVAQKGFKIEGKMAGYADGTEIRLIKNGESTNWLTTIVKNATFTISGKTEEPMLTYLFLGTEQVPVELFIENKTITFKADKSKPAVYDIKGSTSQDEFRNFVDIFLPLVKDISTVANQLNSTMPGAEHDKLMDSYTEKQANVQAVIDQMVKEKPKSYVTAFILQATYNFNEDVAMLENRFNQLDATIKKSETGKALLQDIADKKVGAIGTAAVDFSQPDPSGKQVSLSSFKGKYVLIDFWASWCGPCRQENPTVVQNYKKFSNKNFTVLGVSLDRDGQKDKWLEAIKKDNLTWTHVSDLKFWDNAAAKLYKVQSIPQNFLIDPNGMIVAKNLRGPELEAKLCELLGCN